MKHISWAILLLLSAGTAFGQAPVSVSLAATPAGSTQLGQNILLTATVRTPGVGVQPVGGGGTIYDRDRMRFTFKAQKTWPCPGAVTNIAENVSATGGSSGRQSVVHVTHTASTHFVQPAAGEYILSVDVTYPSGKTPGLVQTPAGRMASIGTASLAKYLVKPQSGFANILSSISPPSPATAPASVGLTLYFNNPEEGYWYRYRYSGAGSAGSKDKQGSSTTFQFVIPNPGQYTFSIGADRVYSTDCSWRGTLDTHMQNPYYYVVKAPTP